MEKELLKTYIDCDISIDKYKNYKKAISSYIGEDADILDKDPDLQYNMSILVSEGGNKNLDGFLREVLCRIFKTPRHKFVNFEHDTHGEKILKNPHRYQIVGHIYDSALCTHAGENIPENEVIKDEDGQWFLSDSLWRDMPLDIKVLWVLYQFEFPDLADLVKTKFENNDNEKFGVSMEVLFSDYKFRVGDFDPSESFDFDANSIGAIEAKKGTLLGEKLKDYWKNKKLYNGKKVYRILGGEIFFSGMAITANRANDRSINLSIDDDDSAMASLDENSDIYKIIKSVASKSETFDKSVCKITEDGPDCNCLVAIANEQNKELTEILDNINILLKDIKASGGILDDETEEADDEEETPEFYLKKANDKLKNLYENNLDNDLSKEEIMEYVEEIEKNLIKAYSFLQKDI